MDVSPSAVTSLQHKTKQNETRRDDPCQVSYVVATRPCHVLVNEMARTLPVSSFPWHFPKEKSYGDLAVWSANFRFRIRPSGPRKGAFMKVCTSTISGRFEGHKKKELQRVVKSAQNSVFSRRVCKGTLALNTLACETGARCKGCVGSTRWGDTLETW